MKNIIKLSALLLLMFSVTLSFGQELENDSDKREIKNEISLEVLQIINGVYQISYERHIWDNFSAALAFGIKGKEGLVAFSGIDTDKIKTNELFYTGYMIAPEIRYYISGTSKFNKNLNGFYVGLYFKYSSFTSDLKGRYTDSNDIDYDIEFKADLDISSVGLMIGYKLQITKRFNIDFLIAGPGSGSYSFNLNNKKDLPDEFYEDLNDALEEYSVLDFINSDFRFSQVDNRSNFSAISFRYGIAVGYTF